jgi:hypothetical protein
MGAWIICAVYVFLTMIADSGCSEKTLSRPLLSRRGWPTSPGLFLAPRSGPSRAEFGRFLIVGLVFALVALATMGYLAHVAWQMSASWH